MDGVFFDDLPGACCNSEHTLPSHYSPAQTKVMCDATLDNFNAVLEVTAANRDELVGAACSLLYRTLFPAEVARAIEDKARVTSRRMKGLSFLPFPKTVKVLFEMSNCCISKLTNSDTLIPV